MVEQSLISLEKLQTEGCLVVDDFLDAITTQELIDSVDSMVPDAKDSRTRRGVPFARRNLLGLAFVRDLLAHQSIKKVVEELGRDLIAVRGILFDKNGKANWTVPWHQDLSIAVAERIDVPGFGPWSKKADVVHVQPPAGILREMITLRIHLDPCGLDNGPLRIIPGTHHRPLKPFEVENRSAADAQKVCITSAGGLIIMRPLTLHASSPATNPSHRRVIHLEFGPRQLPGGLQWAMA